MKVQSKKILAETQDTKITKLEVHAPLIAAKARPGQFVVLMTEEVGERVPLTVVDGNRATGAITLIFQELGFTTRKLGEMNVGDSLYALVGPLGHKTEIKKYGKVIIVGGGVGIAEIYPVTKALKNTGNHVTTILGARTESLLILENELRVSSDEAHITTDDGTSGKKGFTTDILKELLAKGAYDLIYAVGPIPMMKKVSQVSKDSNTKTIVSLNALMVDGTGMCGCCRVTVGGTVKFSCIDGPEFDSHLVDWEELENRSRIYCSKEDHICKHGFVADRDNTRDGA